MKKNRLFFMFAALLVAAAVMFSCQKEEMGELELKGGTDPFTWTDVCAGEEITFTLVGTENSDQIRMWGWDAEEEEYAWLNVGNRSFTTTLDAGDYYFYYRKDKVNYPTGIGPSSLMTDGIKVTIEDCCVPGFTYVDNGDGTYTFSLTPEEDMAGAELVFTFAQSAYQSGLPVEEGWEQAGNEGQVMKTTLDLVECETLTWTVTLTANCSGKSGASNVWTDFKVIPFDADPELEDESGNSIYSMKADPEDKFIQTCPL